VSIKIPPMPESVDELLSRDVIQRDGNTHVVVSVFGIAGASEFDKGVTGSREWFVERSSFDGIGFGRGRTGKRA